MKLSLKILLPLLVIGVGALAAWHMILSRPPVKTRELEVTFPAVRAFEVQPESFQLSVKGQGTVVPRTESVLASEIAGKIIYVSPSLVSGGFFEKADLLVRLDPMDYELSAIQALSAVAQARVNLQREKAEAEIALSEWKDLGEGEATPLLRREPQLAEAEASLDSALAASEQARRNLERTEIRAPFAGRVRIKKVDVGQFVGTGTPLATIYAVDYAEIRLPLPDEELAFVDLPLGYREGNQEFPQPHVLIRARFAGSEHMWSGRIVRTEGEIDPRTRVIHAIAEVKNPYGRGRDPGRPPLAVGMFVEAEIMGRRVDNIFRLPRGALRGNNLVLIVDEQSRLRFRKVELLRSDQETVLITKGLEAGEKVAVVSLESVVDGMEVRVLDDKGIPVLGDEG